MGLSSDGDDGCFFSLLHHFVCPAVSRFHNLSDEALADAIGRADAFVKGAEAELTTLKDEFKARGLADVAGDEFAVTATEQIAVSTPRRSSLPRYPQ